MSRRLPGRNGRQGGITLLLSILVLLTLTFIGIGLLDFTGFDSEVSSNSAQNAAELQASDVGLATASQALQALPGYPETLNMSAYPWWYVPPAVTLPSGAVVDQPSPPVPAGDPPPASGVYTTTYTNTFWQSCANKTCGVVTNWNGNATGVPFAGQDFSVEYVIEPTGLAQQTLNGYESSSPPTPYRIYDAYVYVFRDRPGTNIIENGVLIESGLRKEGG
jgi:Tfp pilus assembly protein PilX